MKNFWKNVFVRIVKIKICILQNDYCSLQTFKKIFNMKIFIIDIKIKI